jgi:molybdopterin-containing oxidoreductase family iron-sulfur binding subunit
MNRRTFLKLAGLGSVTFAAGCSPESPKHLFSQVRAPEDMVTGRAAWYASTCRECPAGCGVIAKNRESRLIKLEGNPLHPINRGRLCMRGQAALQSLYHPDRLRKPLLRENGAFVPVSFEQARALLQRTAGEAAAQGSDRVRVLTEVTGESQMRLFREALAGWNSRRLVVYEPFAYEALKTANREVFGVDGLVSYRMEQADFLLSFGAEFLETWLSPVEYAWKFKAMHAAGGAQTGAFVHVSPFQTLTGTNADRWLACAPGSESILALGLVRHLLDLRRGGHLSPALRTALEPATSAYTPEAVARRTGIPLEDYERLIVALAEARRPLVLGAGSGLSDDNGLRTNLAANLLNLILDPGLTRIDALNRHRVETADRRADVLAFFQELGPGLLMINSSNPVYSLPPGSGVAAALARPGLFVVAFSNFLDETAERAHLVLPVSHPLESWDDFGGWRSIQSLLQPAMGACFESASLGDTLLACGFNNRPPSPDYKTYVANRLQQDGHIRDELQWVQALQRGGIFATELKPAAPERRPERLPAVLAGPETHAPEGLSLAVVPSIRQFDGRGANRAWLSEIPDPVTRVAWQNPLLMHPDTARANGIAHADSVRVRAGDSALTAPAFLTEVVRPGILVMSAGYGHSGYGRYARNRGANPFALLPAGATPSCGGPAGTVSGLGMERLGSGATLAHTDGSRIQHGRAILLAVTPAELTAGRSAHAGLTMTDYPLTLPLPEGYSPQRDFYPAHDHDGYRWAMTVDLDRCTGCGACAAACYAENNVAVVGEEQIARGREMAWMSVERYHDERRLERVMYMPMFCQHCDNAPCESVCPVYAPHHSSEGLNNQIYNRCIGTRFCSQNCPYKVRRFNWFDWEWPEPTPLQLNPEVTVRSKGVMEKCSFCIQRIKDARVTAKNEGRAIRDGEVVPACVQTCPTEALVFGNLMDRDSRVRRLCDHPRAYQAMGYLNTKPAVIYLKKVLHEV